MLLINSFERELNEEATLNGGFFYLYLFNYTLNLIHFNTEKAISFWANGFKEV